MMAIRINIRSEQKEGKADRAARVELEEQVVMAALVRPAETVWPAAALRESAEAEAKGVMRVRVVTEGMAVKAAMVAMAEL